MSKDVSPKKHRLHKASDCLPEIFGLPIKAAAILLSSILLAAFVLITDFSLKSGSISSAIIALGIWFLRNIHKEEKSVEVDNDFPKYFINDL